MHSNHQAGKGTCVSRNATAVQPSFGRLVRLALAGAVLGCASIPFVALLVDPFLPALLVIQPLLGIHLVVSGLIASIVTATAARAARRSGTWTIPGAAACLAVVLFAVPVGLFILNHSAAMR